MTYIFRFFLVFNSLSFSFLIFAIHTKMTLEWLDLMVCNVCTYFVKKDVFVEFIANNFYTLSHITSYVFYFICILLLSIISIHLINSLSDDAIEKDTLTNIEPANDAFLPTYLGYFFVALSVTNINMFIIVFGIIAIFIYYSRISYFNPLFFLFGYKFYYVINSDNVKVLLITKKELKTTLKTEFKQLKRITNYTFIDTEGDK